MNSSFRKYLPLFIAIVFSVFVGFIASRLSVHAGFLDNLFGGSLKSSEAPAASAPRYEASGDYEEAMIGAVDRASPAVVSIVVSKDLPIIEKCKVSPFDDLPPQFKNFFGPFEFDQPCDSGKTQKQEVGGGSGFIVSATGIVITNKHVVSDTKASYTVLTNDGKKWDAKVLARDPIQDLAVLKIGSGNATFPTVTLGNSDTVRLAQTAIAIGNSLGEFRNTVSAGIVSGLSRAIDAGDAENSEHLEGLIQTDAAINPGNSGGPLLNLRGEVIGINTAIAAGAENIGFAIPVNQVKRDIASVEATGSISVPFLGVRYLAITDDLKDREHLSVDYGVIVRGNDDGPAVIPDSPAAKAGLQAEDIILSVDGSDITSNHSLASYIQAHQVGETVTLNVLRAGKKLSVSVKLTERKN